MSLPPDSHTPAAGFLGHQDPYRHGPDTGREAPEQRAGLWGPLTAILIGVVGFVAVYVLMVRTVTGQDLDTTLMRALAPAEDASRDWFEGVLHVIGPVFMVVAWVLILAVVALRRRHRTTLAVAVSGLILLATPRIIKAILERPNLDGFFLPNSLPSGHTAGAAAVVLALLLAVRGRWGSVIATVGGGYIALVGVFVVVLQWHRPSDVVATLFLTLACWGVARLIQGR